MKSSYYLFVLLILLTACAQKVGETKAEEETEINKVITQQDLDDQLTDAVPYVEKYPSGQIKIKGQKVGDVKVGKWTSYYENGMLWSEAEYYKGAKNGKFKDYFENGMLRYKGAYVNDLKQGPWHFYEEDGKINQKVIYHHGDIVED